MQRAFHTQEPWWEIRSYSQFGEDVVAFSYFRKYSWLATGRLDQLETGFYVDVGAHHPQALSNTYLFYQRGWRGINVEPTPNAMKAFEEERPRDINLAIAISSTVGKAKMFSPGGGGLRVENTLSDDFDTTQPHVSYEVETTTLTNLFKKYLPPNTEIDILSIDVEGHDFIALKSNDWEAYRPRFIIVETHGIEITDIQNTSEVFRFMQAVGYRLYAYTPPSSMFVDLRAP